MAEIGAILQEKCERISYLETCLGFAEENLRIAKDQTRAAENLAEEARWEAKQTNGFCMLKNAKIVQLIAQDERIKNECKMHQAKIDDMCTALKRAESLGSSKRGA